MMSGFASQKHIQEKQVSDTASTSGGQQRTAEGKLAGKYDYVSPRVYEPKTTKNVAAKANVDLTSTGKKELHQHTARS